MFVADAVRRAEQPSRARFELKTLEAAGDMRSNRPSQRDGVAGLQRVDNVVVLVDEPLHVAGAATIGRTSDLLMIAQLPTGDPALDTTLIKCAM